MHVLHILHIEHSVSAMDGDQLVDFYWIDTMLTVERITAKSKMLETCIFNLREKTHGKGLVSTHLVVSMVG